MTDLDLDAITARADAATDGSWFVSGGDLVAGHVSHPEVIGPDWASGDDAEFIAHARADVPALVAEVRGLRAEREEAREEATWATLAADTQRERADRLQAVIDAAPHRRGCPAIWYKEDSGLNAACHCWKAGR